MKDLSIVYYTSNHAHQKFLDKTIDQLKKAAGNDVPIVSVSQVPMQLGMNICVGDIGRSHLNIYRQILWGCKMANTKYVAMAEDDILYSFEHFHSELPGEKGFLYDMAKVSLFTWTEPPMFSFRTNRRVINQLIADRKLLIEALEERFRRLETLLKTETEDEIIKRWGDIGRYEERLGVTVRKADEFYSRVPSIVFSHPEAFGYEFNQGKRKKLGDLKIIELFDWGRAEDVLKIYTDGLDENLPVSSV